MAMRKIEKTGPLVQTIKKYFTKSNTGAGLQRSGSMPLGKKTAPYISVDLPMVDRSIFPYRDLILSFPSIQSGKSDKQMNSVEAKR
jgi:hypothetical protein